MLLLGVELQFGDKPLAELRHGTAGAGSALARAALLAIRAGPALVRRGLGVRRRLARRTEAQRAVRHLQHRFAAVGRDAHISRHARQQFAAFVVGREDRDVGHDVLHVLRGLAHALHFADERPARERVDGERGALADANPAHVRFVDRGLDLHVAQVLGNDEEFRRLQAGRDGLPDVDRALDHDAVHRRPDLRARQVDLC